MGDAVVRNVAVSAATDAPKAQPSRGVEAYAAVAGPGTDKGRLLAVRRGDGRDRMDATPRLGCIT
jgi:hypothetical protein